MAKFRKKPVQIDAWPVKQLLDLVGSGEWKDLPRPVKDALDRQQLLFAPDSLSIDTLEGWMQGNVDDWLIMGVKGELYPCKPDVFALTYTTPLDGPAPPDPPGPADPLDLFPPWVRAEVNLTKALSDAARVKHTDRVLTLTMALLGAMINDGKSVGRERKEVIGEALDWVIDVLQLVSAQENADELQH